MNPIEFYEMILDNISDGIYVLDDKGNYLFVNSAYIRFSNTPKARFDHCNVHDFLKDGSINFCISDIVYREKRRVVMFQDVNLGNHVYRQLVISSPVFNAEGNVQNIVAVVKPVSMINDHYHEASSVGYVSSFFLNLPTKEEPIVAESNEMRMIFNTAETIAAVDSAVLISGESGTGKEVIAQYIHNVSPRNQKKLVTVNCASVPENLLEAELFGYEKGAFTGASPGGKIGMIEEADGGTLFLDEINSMPLAMQGKLLRVIETKQIQPLGSTKNKVVDFRLLTATNEDLQKLVDEKGFRRDLFYRLNVIPLNLPPLKEHRADIIPLAMHFLNYYCKKYGKIKMFTKQVLEIMMNYSWPGNIRELKNYVERAVVMSIGEYIEITDIRTLADGRDRLVGVPVATLEVEPSKNLIYDKLISEGVSLKDYLEHCEREYINYSLNLFKNTYEAAEALGTSQSSIMRRKKKYSF